MFSLSYKIAREASKYLAFNLMLVKFVSKSYAMKNHDLFKAFTEK